MKRNQIKLPYKVRKQAELTAHICFFIILWAFCILVSLIEKYVFQWNFHNSRFFIFLLPIIIVWLLRKIDKEEDSIVLTVNKEGLYFNDDEVQDLFLSWRDISKISIIRLPRNGFNPRFVLQVDITNGPSIVYHYGWKISNLYKFRRVLRYASGRYDIMSSKWPLWWVSFP